MRVRSLLPAFKNGNLHNFKRVEFSTGLVATTDATGFAGLSYEFSLDQITDYLNIAQLFDSFKILKVICKLTPYRNSFDAPNVMPQVVMGKDYDDSNAPTSAEKLLCRHGAFLSPFSKSQSISLRPKISGQVYSGGIASNYKQTKGWLDLPASASTPHYGVKCGFVASPLQQINFHLSHTYYLAFKQPVVR